MHVEFAEAGGLIPTPRRQRLQELLTRIVNNASPDEIWYHLTSGPARWQYIWGQIQNGVMGNETIATDEWDQALYQLLGINEHIINIVQPEGGVAGEIKLYNLPKNGRLEVLNENSVLYEDRRVETPCFLFRGPTSNTGRLNNGLIARYKILRELDHQQTAIEKFKGALAFNNNGWMDILLPDQVPADLEYYQKMLVGVPLVISSSQEQINASDLDVYQAAVELCDTQGYAFRYVRQLGFVLQNVDSSDVYYGIIKLNKEILENMLLQFNARGSVHYNFGGILNKSYMPMMVTGLMRLLEGLQQQHQEQWRIATLEETSIYPRVVESIRASTSLHTGVSLVYTNSVV